MQQFLDVVAIEKGAFVSTVTVVCQLIYIDIYRYIYKSHAKSSKPLLERRAISEHFCGSNPLPLLLKLEKTNSDFSINFCAAETHKNVRSVQQI